MARVWYGTIWSDMVQYCTIGASVMHVVGAYVGASTVSYRTNGLPTVSSGIFSQSRVGVSQRRDHKAATSALLPTSNFKPLSVRVLLCQTIKFRKLMVPKDDH
jgi:hypothetical protein